MSDLETALVWFIALCAFVQMLLATRATVRARAYRKAGAPRKTSETEAAMAVMGGITGIFLLGALIIVLQRR